MNYRKADTFTSAIMDNKRNTNDNNAINNMNVNGSSII